jgi:hypothetical protein
MTGVGFSIGRTAVTTAGRDFSTGRTALAGAGLGFSTERTVTTGAGLGLSTDRTGVDIGETGTGFVAVAAGRGAAAVTGAA